MSGKQNSGRIPADKTNDFTRWELPEVNEGQIVHAEKTRRDIARDAARGAAPKVDKNLVVYNKLTAGQIAKISKRIQKDIQKEAYQDGLKKGRDEGYQAGLKQGQQEIQVQLDNLQAVTAHLVDALQSQDNQVEQALVNLSVSVAQSVLRRELSIDSSHIESVITDAINAINAISAESEPVAIYLNPQDYQLLSVRGQVPSEWQLHSDEALSAGGCRVKNQYSVVDYTLEDQFQQTVNQLVETRFAELARQEREGQNQPPEEPAT